VKRATRSKPLVLIFDEIEFISPLAQLDQHWRQDFIAFWQTLWSYQSRQGGLSLILAGVNPTVTERSVYDGVQNPLFGIVSPQYLRGLAPEDTKRMVKTLGKRMGLRFDPDGIEYLQERYGGHPLLTRIACSLFNTALTRSGASRPVVVNREGLVSSEVIRDSELSFYCEHVVFELRQFYPGEYAMLEALARKDVARYLQSARLGAGVKHLQEYGLVVDKHGVPDIAIPVVEQYVAGLAGGVKIIPPEQRAAWVPQRIQSLIHDLRALERRIEAKKAPSLFGPNSFSEADRLRDLGWVHDQEEFDSFINVLNRCLVESVERWGTHEGKPNYFWNEVRCTYPALQNALERVKVYRNNAMHLVLQPQVEQKLAEFLKEDLEGRQPSEVDDLWFILQQRVLDGLFAAVQAEAIRLN